MSTQQSNVSTYTKYLVLCCYRKDILWQQDSQTYPHIQNIWCCVAIGRTSYVNTTVKRIRIYQIQQTAYKKTASEDGLIQSETCRAYIENKV